LTPHGLVFTMNDTQIREGLHKKLLKRHHICKDTLVVNELGLRHGTNRADIVVINGNLVGYEIKSDKDSLHRLKEQVPAYTSVFDWSSVVVGTRHKTVIESLVPDNWGVIVSYQGPRGGVHFETLRVARRNQAVDPFAIAQLLWRDEAVAILAEKDVPARVLRQCRSVLYKHLVEMLSLSELQSRVRAFLKNRRNWRHPAQPFQDGGLCRPTAKL